MSMQSTSARGPGGTARSAAIEAREGLDFRVEVPTLPGWAPVRPRPGPREDADPAQAETDDPRPLAGRPVAAARGCDRRGSEGKAPRPPGERQREGLLRTKKEPERHAPVEGVICDVGRQLEAPIRRDAVQNLHLVGAKRPHPPGEVPEAGPDPERVARRIRDGLVRRPQTR